MSRVRRNRRNRLEFPGVVLHFQTFPGTGGTDADRGVARVPYRVKIANRLWQTGDTQPDGSVSVPMPPGYDQFKLEIFGLEFTVNVVPSVEPLALPSLAGKTGGDTDPNLPGVKRRLELLGYLIDVVDDVLSVEAEDAILRFQADSGQTADGLVGDGTKSALERATGEA